MNGQGQFDFDGGGENGKHEMECPTCQGRGRVPFTPEPSHRARSTDPVTSHEGVEHVRDLGSFGPESWRGKLLVVYGTKQTDGTHPQLTREEAANLVSPRDQDFTVFETVRKRVSELLAKNVEYLTEVLDADGKVVTSPSPWSGKRHEVLVITPLGLSALKHMLDTGMTR